MGKQQKAYIPSSSGGGFRHFLKWVAYILLLLFLIWGVTGGVNWVSTGKNILAWTIELSYKVGHFVFDNSNTVIVPNKGATSDNAKLPIIGNRLNNLTNGENSNDKSQDSDESTTTTDENDDNKE